jgi:hypothetical protein
VEVHPFFIRAYLGPPGGLWPVLLCLYIPKEEFDGPAVSKYAQRVIAEAKQRSNGHRLGDQNL